MKSENTCHDELATEIITDDIINQTRTWLGAEGIAFFRKIKKEHKNIATACWMEGSIPHPVHFREGMQVRNYLRGIVKWTDHQYDDNWAEVIERAIA